MGQPDRWVAKGGRRVAGDARVHLTHPQMRCLVAPRFRSNDADSCDCSPCPCARRELTLRCVRTGRMRRSWTYPVSTSHRSRQSRMPSCQRRALAAISETAAPGARSFRIHTKQYTELMRPRSIVVSAQPRSVFAHVGRSAHMGCQRGEPQHSARERAKPHIRTRHGL
jgi:hypothetical protein